MSTSTTKEFNAILEKQFQLKLQILENRNNELGLGVHKSLATRKGQRLIEALDNYYNSKNKMSYMGTLGLSDELGDFLRRLCFSVRYDNQMQFALAIHKRKKIVGKHTLESIVKTQYVHTELGQFLVKKYDL